MPSTHAKRMIDRLISTFGARRLGRFDRPPVLIGGAPRSGTTLLLGMLSAHPEIFGIPGETKAFLMWERCPDDSRRYRPTREHRLHRALLNAKVPAGKRRWCEKTPGNVRFVGKLLDHFSDEKGDAKFVHIVRDGRDVLTSRHPRNPDGYWVEPEEWIWHVRAGLRFADDPRVLTIRYESLVREFSATMRGVCEFLDVPFAAELERWTENASFSRDIAWPGRVEAQHARSIAKWAKVEHADRLAEIMAHDDCVALLQELGYVESGSGRDVEASALAPLPSGRSRRAHPTRLRGGSSSTQKH